MNIVVTILVIVRECAWAGLGYLTGKESHTWLRWTDWLMSGAERAGRWVMAFGAPNCRAPYGDLYALIRSYKGE